MENVGSAASDQMNVEQNLHPPPFDDIARIKVKPQKKKQKPEQKDVLSDVKTRIIVGLLSIMIIAVGLMLQSFTTAIAGGIIFFVLVLAIPVKNLSLRQNEERPDFADLVRRDQWQPEADEEDIHPDSKWRQVAQVIFAVTVLTLLGIAVLNQILPRLLTEYPDIASSSSVVALMMFVLALILAGIIIWAISQTLAFQELMEIFQHNWVNLAFAGGLVFLTLFLYYSGSFIATIALFFPPTPWTEDIFSVTKYETYRLPLSVAGIALGIFVGNIIFKSTKKDLLEIERIDVWVAYSLMAVIILTTLWSIFGGGQGIVALVLLSGTIVFIVITLGNIPAVADFFHSIYTLFRLIVTMFVEILKVPFMVISVLTKTLAYGLLIMWRNPWDLLSDFAYWMVTNVGKPLSITSKLVKDLYTWLEEIENDLSARIAEDEEEKKEKRNKRRAMN